MRQVYSCIRSDRRSGLAGGNRQLQSFKSNPPTLPRASFNPHSDRRPEAPQWINTTATTTCIGQWSDEMPVIRQLPDSKRRSRTGCLPCRSRRRKCRTISPITLWTRILHTILKSIGDEGKPSCRNCSSRDVTCEYADYTFVPETPFTATSHPKSLAADGDFSRSNTVQSPSIHVPSPHSAITASPHQSHVGAMLSSHLPSPSLASISSSADAPSLAGGDPRSDNINIAPWTSATYTDNNSTHEATIPSRWIGGHIPPQGPTNTSSALLRFRYQVSPWIDSNNGRSVFGPAMMTLARSSKVVPDCILYCMRSRDDSIGTPGTLSRDSDARQRLLERLSQEPALEADVGRALLAVNDIFCHPPSEWAARLAPPVRRCAEEISSSRAPGFITEPLKTLLRLHLKIGK
jgi:hypothetical protein